MSTIDNRLLDAFTESQRARAEVRAGEARLPGGGGDGTSDDMQERVARLEKQIDQVGKDVGDMRVDVATLKENVRHLPTKPWMFQAFAALLASISLLVTLIVGLIVRFLPHAG